MRAPAHARFPLDVHHALLADIGARRYAVWLAKGDIAHLVDGETVDLANTISIEINHNGALQHRFLDAVRDQPGAVNALFQGLVHMLAKNQVCFALRRPE